MNELIEEMWAIPAHTETGRSSKVLVLLASVLDWWDPDELVD
jgi:hypothetical protein